MTDITERKAKLEQMLRTANALDEQGKHDLADELTRIATAGVEAMEDDIDAEDAASPVDDSDPFAKGFGKSIHTLCKKLNSVCGTNNLKKKLRDLCDASGKDAACARKVERTLEDACDALSELCD